MSTETPGHRLPGSFEAAAPDMRDLRISHTLASEGSLLPTLLPLLLDTLCGFIHLLPRFPRLVTPIKVLLVDICSRVANDPTDILGALVDSIGNGLSERVGVLGES